MQKNIEIIAKDPYRVHGTLPFPPRPWVECTYHCAPGPRPGGVTLPEDEDSYEEYEENQEIPVRNRRGHTYVPFIDLTA